MERGRCYVPIVYVFRIDSQWQKYEALIPVTVKLKRHLKSFPHIRVATLEASAAQRSKDYRPDLS